MAIRPQPVLSCTAALAIVSAIASAQARFVELPRRAPPSDHTVSTFAVTLADFDADGWPDVLTGSGRPLYYARNTGDARFVDLSTTHLPVVHVLAIGIVVADFDADGRLDAFLPSIDGATAPLYALLRNNGARGFIDASANLPVRPPNRHSAAAAADFDGDGDLDLVVGCWNWFGTAPETFALINDGTGRFTDGGQIGPWLDQSEMAAADVDGDGDFDFFSATVGFTVIHYNVGGFSFVAKTIWSNAGFGLEIGDVDGDGDVDFVRDRFELYLNDGFGAFTDVSATHLPRFVDRSTHDSFKLVDMENDGDLDLLSYPNGPTKLVSVLAYENDGTGHFRDVSEYGPVERIETTGSLDAADLDLDGDVDLMVGGSIRYSPASPRLFLNLHRQVEAPAAPTPGGTYRLNVHTTFGQAAVLAIGGRTASYALPPFGTYRLDPLTAVVLPALNLQQQPWVTIPVPNDPGLVGVPVRAQALVVDPAQFTRSRFSNLWLDAVQ